MAKRRSKRKKALTATQKLRKNVRATIRRAESKGIRFSDALKKKISTAKYQTLKSLQRNKYEKLYAQGTALSPTGEIITGTQARVLIRRESAKKAAETRRINKLLKSTTPEGERVEKLLKETPEEKRMRELKEMSERMGEREKIFEGEYEEETFDNEEGFEEEERQRWEDWAHNKDNKAFQDAVSYGEAMYQNIRDIITAQENMGAGNFGMYFTALVDHYVDKYGYDNFRAAISTIPQDEFDEKVHDVLYYSGEIDRLAAAVDALQNLIDRALLYSGLTPDFTWDKSFDQMKQEDFSPFSSEEFYPY